VWSISKEPRLCIVLYISSRQNKGILPRVAIPKCIGLPGTTRLCIVYQYNTIIFIRMWFKHKKMEDFMRVDLNDDMSGVSVK
jgi:hypothetical protein